MRRAGTPHADGRQRLSAYQRNPMFDISRSLIRRHGDLSFQLPANQRVFAAYAGAENIYYIGYLQPFAGYRRQQTAEDAMLDKRFQLLESVHGHLWSLTAYRRTIEPIYARYREAWAELARRFNDSRYVRFIDLTTLFSGVDETVYLDQIHYNERGNVILAEQFSRDIVALIGSR